mmetsp:Transcript_33491/g.62750  ORF Transcript_33491/g.62750 Transcript_33491/m.62750 type:complete len:88 (-) Transcript_33491:265-528(-)
MRTSPVHHLLQKALHEAQHDAGQKLSEPEHLPDYPWPTFPKVTQKAAAPRCFPQPPKSRPIEVDLGMMPGVDAALGDRPRARQSPAL